MPPPSVARVGEREDESMFEVFRGVDDADGFRSGEDTGEATIGARSVGEFEGQVEDADEQEFQGADDDDSTDLFAVEHHCGTCLEHVSRGDSVGD